MDRTFISITGDERVHFLQGILTQDVTRLAHDKIQFAAMLSPQGKILHDMFLIDTNNAILIDTAAEFAAVLVKRLTMYKLRAKVMIRSSDDPMIRELALSVSLPDPRHPDLPHYSPRTTHHAPLFPLLGRDFAPDTLTALDAGYDLLNAVSFTKGCYVGQEITARMHYKAIARRGWFLLTRDGVPPQLANLKFDDILDATDATSPPTVLVDNISYRACLLEWMQPKYTQFKSASNKQL